MSNWLTMTEDAAESAAANWYREAIAQRERAENAVADMREWRSKAVAQEDYSGRCITLQRQNRELRELVEDYQVQAELFAGDGSHLDPTLAELRSRLAHIDKEGGA